MNKRAAALALLVTFLAPSGMNRATSSLSAHKPVGTAKLSARDARLPAVADEAVEHLNAVESYSALRKAVSAERYAIRPEERAATSDARTTYRAPNPAQHYTVHFGADDVAIVGAASWETERRTQQRPWRMQMRLARYGFGARSVAPQRGERRVVGNRIEHARGAVTEWYVNQPTGLESTVPGFQLFVSDFNRDTFADVLGCSVSSGAWYQCLNIGASFTCGSGSWEPELIVIATTTRVR